MSLPVNAPAAPAERRAVAKPARIPVGDRPTDALGEGLS